MKRVIIESPFGSRDPAVVSRNRKYVLACLLDCFRRGEAPFASHALYTLEGLLDDQALEERRQGILAGLAWGEAADATVVYTDYGITEGMKEGIANARSCGRQILYRNLGVGDMEVTLDVPYVNSDGNGMSLEPEKIDYPLDLPRASSKVAIYA